MKTVKTMTSAEKMAKLRAKEQKKKLQKRKDNTKFESRKAARNNVTFKPKMRKTLAAEVALEEEAKIQRAKETGGVDFVARELC